MVNNQISDWIISADVTKVINRRVSKPRRLIKRTKRRPHRRIVSAFRSRIMSGNAVVPYHCVDSQLHRLRDTAEQYAKRVCLEHAVTAGNDYFYWWVDAAQQRFIRALTSIKVRKPMRSTSVCLQS